MKEKTKPLSATISVKVDSNSSTYIRENNKRLKQETETKRKSRKSAKIFFTIANDFFKTFLLCLDNVPCKFLLVYSFESNFKKTLIVITKRKR